MDSQDKNPVPRYVINASELHDALSDKVDPIVSDIIINTLNGLVTFKGVLDRLDIIKNLLPANRYKSLVDKISLLLQYNPVGEQKISSRMLDIPPIIGGYKAEFVFNNIVYITGVEINQNGWKKDDQYSLIVNGNKIIDRAYFKEIGEHKYLNTYYKVNSDDIISFILHNVSGNSRKLFVDLEYIV